MPRIKGEPKLTIPRNELKFFIHVDEAAVLEKRLNAVMQRDLHTDAASSYQIRSLYFDDPNGSAYLDKVNGVEKREKYRIRFYNHSLSYIRLERKAKIGKQSLKIGCALSLQQATQLLCPLPELKCEEADLLSDFISKIRTENFRPLLFVDYNRKAFFHPTGNVRITLDSDLHATRFRGDLLDEKGAIPCLSDGKIILEVKYDSVIPPYLSALLCDIPKVNCAISKYCLCYEQLC